LEMIPITIHLCSGHGTKIVHGNTVDGVNLNLDDWDKWVTETRQALAEQEAYDKDKEEDLRQEALEYGSKI
jgi:hypothetical protein